MRFFKQCLPGSRSNANLRKGMAGFILCCLLAAVAQAQMPASDIYAFSIKKTPEGEYRLGKPVYLTAFNPEGYNNHPGFFNDSTLYISSQLPGEEQPELYALDIKNQNLRKVTATGAGEYSPRLMPDYFHFSAVRMEYGETDTLIRVWKFPLHGQGGGRPILPHLGNVGYYHWLNSTDIAVFLLGETIYLARANLFDTRVDTISSDPGRCFRTRGPRDLVYVKKSNPDRWELMQYDLETGQSRFLIQTRPGQEDFAVMPDGDIIMGDGSKLFVFNPSEGRTWREIADLGTFQIENISRLDVSANGMLALVAQ